jgi:putative transposase
MPFVKLWIHLIWSTKNRTKIISRDLKPLLLDHIRSNAKEKSIFLNSVNCVEDHIHLLVSLSTDQTVAKVVQLIKGESSHWVNAQNLLKFKFEWQDEYIALTVSDSVVEKVREYIRNQEEHHRVKSFAEEYALFEKKYGFRKE